MNRAMSDGYLSGIIGSHATPTKLAAALNGAIKEMWAHYEYQTRYNVNRGRKGSDCVCPACDAMRAIESALGVSSPN